jgi:phosphoribosylformylglycinamidine synthase
MSKAKFGVIVFPGSNCDHDAYNVLKNVLKQDTCFLWHKDSSIGNRNVLIIPGGFSYGDYLRCGAIARFSNIMKEVVKFAHSGGIVLGICNGFQILCESGLLPGVLLRNQNLKFVCKFVTLKINNTDSIFTNAYKNENFDHISVPVAHGDGNYYCDINKLNELKENSQILFRYEENPNGSIDNIAGIINKNGNVLGMMPHPERASEKLLGCEDGKLIFQSIINYLN